MTEDRLNKLRAGIISMTDEEFTAIAARIEEEKRQAHLYIQSLLEKKKTPAAED